ncbi:hypothetical protein K432DRAFT_382077 [Lepidopterella palustris CBS 459.81]|uniref:Uncharacterized protein n=1 Tax=Lepidopterella palustris CBS 459.81 TaxID=1314670 RepID=A0A8E2JG00_9PEZI|nr:hypothetical protein K432DRAFT_382077 [Lepidopterella palustris CBS 459.81]
MLGGKRKSRRRKAPAGTRKAPAGSRKAPAGNQKAPAGNRKAPTGNQKAPGGNRIWRASKSAEYCPTRMVEPGVRAKGPQKKS